MISDARYATGDKDDYFKRISGIPDKKFYLNLDLIRGDDPEVFNVPLYPFKNSTSHFSTAVINNIKYHMTNFPPLYNWDQMNKVNFNCIAILEF